MALPVPAKISHPVRDKAKLRSNRLTCLAGDGAIFDRSGDFRYILWRNLAGVEHDNFLSIIMLNPSQADAQMDDPTIRSCRRLALNNGFGGFIVTNLYAYCTPYPRELFQESARFTPNRMRETDKYIALGQTFSRATLLAWGAKLGTADFAQRSQKRVKQVLQLVGKNKAYVLGLTQDGHPRHPLYVAAQTKLSPLPADFYCS